LTRRASRPVWTLDCETDPFKPGRVPQPFLWGLYTGSDYHEFATGREVAAFCAPHRALVYAHNGGKFDFHYLRDHINSDEPLMIINQRLARFRIGECEFRDSVNLIPVRLADFQKEKVDYSIFETDVRDRPEHRATIRAYLRSDCVNLHEMLTRYFETYSRGLTQAGAAMKFWERLSHLSAPRQHATQYARYKPFYYGGRVECFRVGDVRESFTVADINSAYPFAMLSPHPFSPAAHESSRLSDRPEDWARCLVRLRAVSRGAFPFRESDGRLSFPNDATVREYAVTGYELQAAVDTDTVRIVEVRDVYYFPEVVDFRAYVEHFYALRIDAKARGDVATDIFAKIFLNSLYGKFGANPEKYNEYLITSEARYLDWIAEGYERANLFDDVRYLLRRPLPEHRHRHFNIATAASITGYVRAMLWRSILKCRDPIYCDTDSIAARDTSALEFGPALGQWKLELTGDRFAVAGKKLYAYHRADATADDERTGRAWKTASKGVNLTATEIARAAAGETVNYLPAVPTYSVLRREPIFTPRLVRRTGSV
jgi:hypothetical protein